MSQAINKTTTPITFQNQRSLFWVAKIEKTFMPVGRRNLINEALKNKNWIKEETDNGIQLASSLYVGKYKWNATQMKQEINTSRNDDDDDSVIQKKIEKYVVGILFSPRFQVPYSKDNPLPTFEFDNDDKTLHYEVRQLGANVPLSLTPCMSRRLLGYNNIVIFALNQRVRFWICTSNDKDRQYGYPIQQYVIEKGQAIFLPRGTKYGKHWFLAPSCQAEKDGPCYVMIFAIEI